MRKVTYGVGCSLDNYIARADGGVDWLMWSDDVQRVSADYWKTIDTVVMGRKTYEAAVNNGIHAYPGVKNYVFSRNWAGRQSESVEIVSEDPALFIKKLQAQQGTGICCMGGGELAAALLDAGLIHEIGLNIHPILLGSGVPLFSRLNRPVKLRLLERSPLAHECIYLLYGVLHE